MYLDSGLARSVLDEAADAHHAQVPCEGVDLELVKRHAWEAGMRHAVRDLLLFFALVFLVVFFFGGNPLLALAALLALWAIVAWDAYSVRYDVLAKGFGQGTGGQASPQATGRDNVTIYRGFWPFRGFGQRLDNGSWSLALDCGKPAEPGGRIDAFSVGELHQAVVDGVRALRLADIRIEDRLFVSGTDIREMPMLLPDPERPPVSRVPPGVIASLMEDPNSIARHYLRIGYHGWGDEIVANVFVRLVLAERSLFVECNLSVLGPIKAAYHEVDDITSQPTFKQVRVLATESLRRMPGLALRSFFGLLGWWTMSWRHSKIERAQRREIREHRAFDYGAGPSLRERAADFEYHRYFQRLDKERYVKVIVKRVLDSIVEFLASRGIDTSDLRERGTTILNNGVMVSGGGSLTAGSVAAGAGASARNRVVEAAKAAFGQG
jgi:hypothetical protein